jgi:hypothetical protein
MKRVALLGRGLGYGLRGQSQGVFQGLAQTFAPDAESFVLHLENHFTKPLLSLLAAAAQTPFP